MTTPPPSRIQDDIDLTSRQRQVMDLMVAGKTNWEIAQVLGVSLEGAKYHVSEILARFDVTSREEAVERWRASRRPAARVRRWAHGAIAGFAAKSFEVKAALTVAAVAGVVGGAALVFLAQGGDDSTPDGPPETPEQLLAQMDERLGASGDILHISVGPFEGSSDATAYTLDVEGWFDFEAGKALLAYEQQWENEPTPKTREELLDGVYVYEIPTMPATPGRSSAAESRPACLPFGSYLAAIIACGVVDGDDDAIDPNSVKLLSDTTWEGRPAYAIEYGYSFENSSSPRPDGFAPPTSTPGPETPTVADPNRYTVTLRWVFYVDPATMLPLALETSATRSDQGSMGTQVIEYDSELVGRDRVDPAIFNAREQGYRPPEEIERDTLDNAVPGGPLYWLGSRRDAGDGLPELTLENVEVRNHPERPELIALRYASPDGESGMAVAMWEEQGWLDFFARLQESGRAPGSDFVFAEDCMESTETTVNGMRVRILAGARIEPVLATPAIATQSTPAPTATRGPGEACPPRDLFMAEVYVGDGYIVTVNAPVYLYDSGTENDPLNSPEALEAVVAGLRERQPGE